MRHAIQGSVKLADSGVCAACRTDWALPHGLRGSRERGRYLLNQSGLGIERERTELAQSIRPLSLALQVPLAARIGPRDLQKLGKRMRACACWGARILGMETEPDLAVAETEGPHLPDGRDWRKEQIWKSADGGRDREGE